MFSWAAGLATVIANGLVMVSFLLGEAPVAPVLVWAIAPPARLRAR